MSDDMDSGASAVERMMHDRVRQAPPPALRSRVLTAVADVLHDDRYEQPSQLAAEIHRLTVGGLMATALSLLLMIMLSWAAVSHPVGSATVRPMLSFAQRAEAAGITLDIASPSTAHVAGRDIRLDEGARPRDIFRSIDSRLFLQGEL